MTSQKRATKLNPYLTLPGTAADAIALYENVFNVAPVSIQRFSDMPPQEEMSASPSGVDRILHAAFQIGTDMLMLSDAPEGQDHTVVLGTQTHVSIHPDSKDEADRMFALLTDGGDVVMPMATQFWGDYFGMCKDPFGIRWMINYREENE